MFLRYTQRFQPKGFQFQRFGLIPFSKAKMSTSNEVPKEPILALPETAEETVNVGINDTYKLKELGPVVVNEDGTISRINNWHEMADIEKSNVNRILLKRNRERLARLKEKAGIEEKTE